MFRLISLAAVCKKKTEKPSVELNSSLDDYRLLWKCCQDSSLSTEDETLGAL